VQLLANRWDNEGSTRFYSATELRFPSRERVQMSPCRLEIDSISAEFDEMRELSDGRPVGSLQFHLTAEGDREAARQGQASAREGKPFREPFVMKHFPDPVGTEDHERISPSFHQSSGIRKRGIKSQGISPSQAS
jgi:hypothetical protein